jgi:hypothetical protein
VGDGIASTRCYIEEYANEEGRLSARLREKHSGRKVDMGLVDAVARRHLLRFLSAAKANRELMPDVFARDGDADCVIVTGDLDFDAPDEIRFVYNDRLSYLLGQPTRAERFSPHLAETDGRAGGARSPCRLAKFALRAPGVTEVFNHGAAAPPVRS